MHYYSLNRLPTANRDLNWPALLDIVAEPVSASRSTAGQLIVSEENDNQDPLQTKAVLVLPIGLHRGEGVTEPVRVHTLLNPSLAS